MGQLFAVEVIYRGVFQKILAKNICRGIVLAAHNEGKLGLSFGRYSDSPERNGIPAKSFAIVANDDQTLEEGMAQYEPKAVDVTIVLDDTLCKGLESWAWQGLQPVNQVLKPNATMVVVSTQDVPTLIHTIHQRNTPYKLAVLKGIPSFSGMWVFKDDHTDVRVLGAISAALPQLFGFPALETYVKKLKGGELKAASAKKAFENFKTVDVAAGEGNQEIPFSFEKPKWEDMREGLTIPGQPQGAPYTVAGETGGFRPARNDKYKKYATRTYRPVVNFETCTKCTLCWLNCPDGSFDITPENTYDANLESCIGCGICEAVCPVPNCITMVHENEFTDLKSQYEAYKLDPAAYKAYVAEKTAKKPEHRAHGFRYRGQYAEEIPVALELANKA